MNARNALCLLVFVASMGHAAPVPKANVGLVTLNFPNNDIIEVLALYESLTHFKIIRDNFIRGKINVFVAEPVTSEKAIEIMERTFFANGFAVTQIDPDTVEIGSSAHARGTGGVPTISDPKDLPAQERLVSYFFQLKYADAAKVVKLFAQYLSPPQPYTALLCPEGTNALWVTERSSVIRQLLIVVDKIDVPPGPQTPRP